MEERKKIRTQGKKKKIQYNSNNNGEKKKNKKVAKRRKKGGYPKVDKSSSDCKECMYYM